MFVGEPSRISYAQHQQRRRAELGKMIGTSGDVTGRYDRGDISPSIEAAAKIADALDVSVDYLIGKTKMELDKDTMRSSKIIQPLRRK